MTRPNGRGLPGTHDEDVQVVGEDVGQRFGHDLLGGHAVEAVDFPLDLPAPAAAAAAAALLRRPLLLGLELVAGGPSPLPLGGGRGVDGGLQAALVVVREVTCGTATRASVRSESSRLDSDWTSTFVCCGVLVRAR